MTEHLLLPSVGQVSVDHLSLWTGSSASRVVKTSNRVGCSTRDDRKNLLKCLYTQFCEMPWERQSRGLDISYTDGLLRRLVYDLVHSELILHTQDCVLTWTPKTLPHGEASYDMLFEPNRSFTSLWGAIWELFGLDTRQYGWNLCQVCGRLFYPKDRRSVCCSTIHQSLWSKRIWARRHRAAIRHGGQNLDREKRQRTKFRKRM
jgi:hypothetical protein